MSIEIDNLIIEVTRRCNMNCPHCLRGEAQNLDIPFDTIDKALAGVTYASQITFSGGEPTLNLPAIRHTLDVCKANNIDVGGFYIVTNGKSVTQEFIMLCLEWYIYVIDTCKGESDYCGVALSRDVFHEPVNNDTVKLLRGLAFFDDKGHDTDFGRVYIINEGRAETLSSTQWKKRELEFYGPNVEIDRLGNVHASDNVYISANGDVRYDCDTSYDDSRATIGNLNDSSLEDILTAAVDCAELA